MKRKAMRPKTRAEDKPHWRTLDGQRLRPRDMGDTHLANAYAMLLRRGAMPPERFWPALRQWVDRQDLSIPAPRCSHFVQLFEDELKRRRLIAGGAVERG